MNTKDQVVKNREVGLKKLYILSKVSERKERVSSLMRKNAFGPFTAPVVVGGIGMSAVTTLLAVAAAITRHLTNVDADSIDSEEKLKSFTTNIVNDLNKKISEKNSPMIFNSCPGAIAYLYQKFFDNSIPITKDPDNELDEHLMFYGDFYSNVMNDGSGGGLIYNGKQNPVWKDIAAQIQKDLEKFKQKIEEAASDAEQESEAPPRSAPRARKPASSIDLSRIRTLLINANYTSQITDDAGWNGLDAAFRSAVADYIKLNRLPITLNGGWQWSEVASKLDFQPNLSGAEKLVEELIKFKLQNNPSTPATPTPTPTPADATDYKAGAKSKLTQLFDAILVGSTKVDRVGIDLRRDTMIFKGVITGLGGPNDAVNYVFSNINFSPDQLKEISNMSLESNQKITVASLALVRNLFINIRRESTKGIGNNAFNANSLARAVNRWKSRQTQQPAPAASTPAAAAAAAADDGLSTQASIIRAIEIRKIAARKKLGI